MVKIQRASFVTSAVDPDGFPDGDLPEVCFAGRSNVGKSSLMNVLLDRKRLVKVSARPGKTQLVNFFRVNDRYSFVDLPGYGYARVSREHREQFRSMVERYLHSRQCLRACLLLLDLRRTPTEEELGFARMMLESPVRLILVGTKLDKLASKEGPRRVQSLADRLRLKPSTVVAFSAVTRQGREELWARIERACR